MLSHERIWAAIDALAERHGMTASGLARKAGLDPTSFNRSKRTSPEGRDRWPSTESIAKILRATGASVEDFLRLIEPTVPPRRALVPLVGMDHARNATLFDEEGMPNEKAGREAIDFPDYRNAEKVFALEVAGDTLSPFYRDGDILIVSPTAGIRKGDRLIVRTRSGEVLAGELKRRLAKSIDLRVLGPGGEERTIATDDVDGIARVMWARQ